MRDDSIASRASLELNFCGSVTANEKRHGIYRNPSTLGPHPTGPTIQRPVSGSKSVKKHKQRQGLHTAAGETVGDGRWGALGAEMVRHEGLAQASWSAPWERVSASRDEDSMGALHSLPWCEWKSNGFPNPRMVAVSSLYLVRWARLFRLSPEATTNKRTLPVVRRFPLFFCFCFCFVFM